MGKPIYLPHAFCGNGLFTRKTFEKILYWKFMMGCFSTHKSLDWLSLNSYLLVREKKLKIGDWNGWWKAEDSDNENR